MRDHHPDYTETYYLLVIDTPFVNAVCHQHVLYKWEVTSKLTFWSISSCWISSGEKNERLWMKPCDMTVRLIQQALVEVEWAQSLGTQPNDVVRMLGGGFADFGAISGDKERHCQTFVVNTKKSLWTCLKLWQCGLRWNWVRCLGVFVMIWTPKLFILKVWKVDMILSVRKIASQLDLTSMIGACHAYLKKFNCTGTYNQTKHKVPR